MNIQHSAYCPDDTYFRVGDVEPTTNGDASLTIYDGNGRRRSWGQPGVTSTIVVNECDWCAIHVGFHHKHGGGQFWRYYMAVPGGVQQIAWAQLPDEARQQVLAGQRPPWAKVPGKLRSQYAKPTTRTQTTYKIVAQDGETLRSLYDGTQYVTGKRLAEAVHGTVRETSYGDTVVTHDGGYYSHPSVETVKRLLTQGNLVPNRCLEHGMTLALIECEISGKIVQYPNGKLCSTYLTPLRVVETIQY